ncbi:MAG TPA: class II glutamine amidotransferase [Rubrivivax sp.]|nr:class II glutamine amidotransferase [Rubrivivax sp.]
MWPPRAAKPLSAKVAAVGALLDVVRHGPFTFLLCDGEALYAHATHRLHWLERRHPFGSVRLVDRDLEIGTWRRRITRSTTSRSCAT